MVRYLPEARDEFEEAVAFYEGQRAELGTKFQIEVVDAIDRITRFPESCAMLDERLRRCRLKTFPFRVIYAVVADEIVIIWVSHQSRKPGHGEGRD